jgi:hypothetical protein
MKQSKFAPHHPRNRVLPSDMKRDAEEVHQYLIEHPRATIGDVSMCCNMGYRQAEAIMQRQGINITKGRRS